MNSLELGKKVIKRVKDEFGISLEWEIKILGVYPSSRN